MDKELTEVFKIYYNILYSFYIGFGAAMGGMLRFWLSNFTYKGFPDSFPFGILVVNVIGSFLPGLIIFYFYDRDLLGPNLRIFLAIGFCGGLVTIEKLEVIKYIAQK